MKIERIETILFRTTTNKMSDSDGHAHPGPERVVTSALLRLTTDDGVVGEVLAPSPADVREDLLERYVRPIVKGADPLRHEQIWQAMYKWQRGSGGKFHDRLLAAVDLALWDLIGKILGQPVWKLVGGYRDKILAYGSTMCGDDMENGLATPEDYGRFAEWLVKERGYKAVKLHTWMPPIPGAPNVKLDVAACSAVREAVGPDIPLMLDPNHWYNRQDTLWLAKQLEELGFLWMEEPMEESSISSYQWLTANTGLNILGPETAAGKYWTRAEWASKAACDMIRTGVWDVGGIGPSMKIGHLAESFHMSCEVHGTGAGNMAICAAIPNTLFYERGLLHPFIDYDLPAPHLKRIDDEMDRDGYVHFRDVAGLGQDIDEGYVLANRID